MNEMDKIEFKVEEDDLQVTFEAVPVAVVEDE